MTSGWRNSITELAPPWLRGGRGEKMLRSFGLLVDAFYEAALQAWESHMPGLGTPTALQWTGRDRQILRGPDEPAASYSVRLRRWLDDWPRAGSSWGVLAQLAGYLTPHSVLLRHVDNSGNWYRNEGGVETFDGALANWDWDGTPDAWSRFWVILYADGVWADDGLWDDPGEWDDGGTWDSEASPEEVTSVRAIWAQWKGTGKRMHVILAFDNASFAPATPEPDGQWGQASKYSGGVQVPARLETASYWDGSN